MNRIALNVHLLQSSFSFMEGLNSEVLFRRVDARLARARYCTRSLVLLLLVYHPLRCMELLPSSIHEHVGYGIKNFALSSLI